MKCRSGLCGESDPFSLILNPTLWSGLDTETVQAEHNTTVEEEAGENVVLAEHEEQADEDQTPEADISQVLADAEVTDVEDSTTETIRKM